MSTPSKWIRRGSGPGVLAFALAAGLLGGCASGVKLNNPVPVESRDVTGGGAGAAADGAASSQGAQSNVATVDLGRQGEGAAAVGRVVHFDFDSFVIKDSDQPVIEGNAKLLVAHRDKQMIIEGHTDERGGREYNLALGQKRAEAVQKAMELLGVKDSQLEAVSFGKERPVDPGHDEAAWAQNRRAELRDR